MHKSAMAYYRALWRGPRTVWGDPKKKIEVPADRIIGENINVFSREFAVELIAPSLARIYDGPGWLGEKIKHVIDEEPVALFMKGTPSFVMCGNSQRALDALRSLSVPVTAVDILLAAADLAHERRVV